MVEIAWFVMVVATVQECRFAAGCPGAHGRIVRCTRRRSELHRETIHVPTDCSQ